jgi:hypothetical protein
VSASDYVTLRGGLTFPVAVLKLLWSLEERGVHVGAKDEHTLIIKPRALLQDEDRAALTRWKPHVLALLQYDAERREGPAITVDVAGRPRVQQASQVCSVAHAAARPPTRRTSRQ